MTPRIGVGAARASTDHLDALHDALHALRGRGAQLDAWGRRLADVLLDGGRLLACGNGGSAAEAQHLTAELVGRYREERRPLSALALCAETSSLTAIGNDYGGDELFARQVRAHGRAGDVLVALSTSGASANVLHAVDAARDCGMTTWALTGAAPNPLAAAADEVLAVDAPGPTAQEIHLVAVHLICTAVDRRVGERERFTRAPARTATEALA
ncbi:SIS domain-containing protein [Conexibacter sp. SYSU D00693]|uniref:D-sedoheptulose-7-phosphate isomerase n=1 Tax=Conexibacter sp. SYSU D00693 TaxID=2812560 RepID=UPI00196B1C3C|nr:SIS domain-containing protein [Conexibacter sp. SYSU D00693]